MDRFMIRLSIGYLDRAAEIQMLQDQRRSTPLDAVEAVMNCDSLRKVQHAVREIRIDDSLQGYIVDIVQKTRQHESLEHGASPRGCLDMQAYAQALALLAGRDYVLPDDVKSAAQYVLPHRLIVRKGTRNVSAGTQSVIESVIDSIPVPV
jgi:MoxR-like ATPase